MKRKYNKEEIVGDLSIYDRDKNDNCFVKTIKLKHVLVDEMNNKMITKKPSNLNSKISKDSL